jgi:hypothetical protein
MQKPFIFDQKKHEPTSSVFGVIENLKVFGFAPSQASLDYKAMLIRNGFKVKRPRVEVAAERVVKTKAKQAETKRLLSYIKL